MKTSAERELAIFWDYGSVELPHTHNAGATAKALVDAVSRYGRIVDRRLYYCKDQQDPQDGITGFDLIRCRTTLDKKLPADALTFCWDSSVRQNQPAVVVLLTADEDYAYLLSKLRDRGVTTIVIHDDDTVLQDTADITLSLKRDVLKQEDKKRCTGFVRKTKQQDDFFILSLLQIIRQNLCDDHDDDWVDLGVVSQQLQQVLKRHGCDDVKDKSREVRKQAEARKLLQSGRRVLGDDAGRKRKIVSHDPTRKLSAELYVSLRSPGRAMLDQSMPSKKMPVQQHRSETPSDYVLSLCQIVQEHRSRRLELDGGWVDLGAVQQQLQQLMKRSGECLDVKEKSRAVRLEGEAREWIETGRRILLPPGIPSDTKKTVVPASASNPDSSQANLSVERYVRVLPKGQDALEGRTTSKKSAQSNNSTTSSKQRPDESRAIICFSIQSLESTQDAWVSKDKVKASFQSHLGTHEGDQAFHEACCGAIVDGSIEMGSSENHCDIVKVSMLRVLSSTSPLVTSDEEQYFLRLLPSGRQLAQQPLLHTAARTPNSKTRMPHDTVSGDVSIASRCVFFSNIAPTTTALTAASLVPFLEADGSVVERIELEHKNYRGDMCFAAHVRYATAQQATKVLQKAKTSGLYYLHGRRLFVALDRSTLDNVACGSRRPDLSFAKEASCITTTRGSPTGVADAHIQGIFDNTAPLITPLKQSDEPTLSTDPSITTEPSNVTDELDVPDFAALMQDELKLAFGAGGSTLMDRELRLDAQQQHKDVRKDLDLIW